MTMLFRFCPSDAALLLTASVLVQIAVAVVAAGVLTSVVARHHAALRHGIWLCALGGVLLSPVVAYLSARAGLSLVSLRLPGSVAVSTVLDVTSPDETTQTAMASTASDDARPMPTREGSVSTEAATAEHVEEVSWGDLGRATIGAVVMVWIVGVVILFGRLLHGSWQIALLRQHVRPATDDRLDGLLAEIRCVLGAERLPTLAMWPLGVEKATPITVGIVRPTVIFPQNMVEMLDRQGLRDVLVHEFAHALRRDPLVGFLQRLAAILYWPYPPVHFLNRRLAWAREEVCDNYVLRLDDAPDYAETLLAISQNMVSHPLQSVAIGLFHPYRSLEHRVANLLDPRRNVMVRIGRIAFVVLIAFFASLMAGISGVRWLQAEQTVEAPATNERFSDVATVGYSGESISGNGSILWPSGYNVVTVSSTNTETEVVVSFAGDQKEPSPKKYRVLAIDREGNRHASIEESSAMGGGTRLRQHTVMSKFSLPSTAIARLVVQGLESDEPPATSGDNGPQSLDCNHIEPFDVIQIEAINTMKSQPISGFYFVEPDGQVALGPAYGRVNLNGLTMEEAQVKIVTHLKEVFTQPEVQVTMARKGRRSIRWREAAWPRLPYTIQPFDVLSVRVINTIPDQPIDGYFLVESGGTIPLGPAYGRVQVKGLTLEAAEEAIRNKLGDVLSRPDVQVTLPNRKSTENSHWQNRPLPTAPYKVRVGDSLRVDVMGTLPDQPIQDFYLVEPAGTIALGPAYGRAKVEGLSLDEAEAAIQVKLQEVCSRAQVSLTLASWEGADTVLARHINADPFPPPRFPPREGATRLQDSESTSPQKIGPERN